MRYPITIEVADETYGVIVPNLPGCFSAGDDLDSAMAGAEEAAAAWIDAALDAGEAIPTPCSLDGLDLFRLDLRGDHDRSGAARRFDRTGQHHLASPGVAATRRPGQSGRREPVRRCRPTYFGLPQGRRLNGFPDIPTPGKRG
jgi:predicted RNase H-like HicB family nuclease